MAVVSDQNNLEEKRVSFHLCFNWDRFHDHEEGVAAGTGGRVIIDHLYGRNSTNYLTGSDARL